MRSNPGPGSGSCRLIEWSARETGCAPHRAPVSVHYGLAGRALYRTREGLYVVEPGRLLVLNEGQTVSTHVARGQRCAGVSVLFAPELVAEVHWTLGQAPERLLDRPFAEAGALPLLAERTHTVDGDLARTLRALRRAQGGEGPGVLEERVHALLAAVLRLDAAACAHGRKSVPAVRAATRAELFSRLQRARDFLHASVERPVTLAEMGRVAALSPHHLLRLFQATFGHTPQRYQRRLRMERAAALLRETTRPVGLIAEEVGFDSFGSFSAAFRRHHGLTPRALRARAR